MTRIGILTAGGDCPGLNAAIRAVVLRATARGAVVLGFEDGFSGLVDDRFIQLTPANSDAILALGGSVLGSSGANPFLDRKWETANEEGAARVRSVAQKHGLECLVVIGGNSSMGTAAEAHDAGIPVVGIPKTIDNDVVGTEVTIGFDTAVATASEAVDRLRTTAESHERVMVVETMGRDVGWICVYAGIAGGADIILTPEEPVNKQALADRVRASHERGRKFSVIVVGEGTRFDDDTTQTRLGGPDSGGMARLGGIGQRIADVIAEMTGYETRVNVLGHLLRGGPPTAADRILATRFGVRAADLALDGPRGVMVAVSAGDLELRPLRSVARRIKPLDPVFLEVARAAGALL